MEVVIPERVVASPGCGEYGSNARITLTEGGCECGTVGQKYSNLASCCNAASDKTGLCDEFNCPVGGGGGGGPDGPGGGGGGGPDGPGGGGDKSCTIGNNTCLSTQYCSVGYKKCTDTPSTWTSDFYKSFVQAMGAASSAPGGPSAAQANVSLMV